MDDPPDNKVFHLPPRQLPAPQAGETGPGSGSGVGSLPPDKPLTEYDIEAGDYVFQYRRSYQEYFSRRGLEGVSLVAISAELGIPWTVMLHWARHIKSLAVAMEMSRLNAQAYWEKIGRNGMEDNKFNMGAWLKMMSVQFPMSWSDPDPLPVGVESPATQDPYGFSEQRERVNATDVAEQVFEKILKIKHSKEAG